MNDSFQNTCGSGDPGDPIEQTLSAAEDRGGETIGDSDLRQPCDIQQSTLGDSEPPEFGLLDVIEAFTAMRHEWRTQTRENRELAAAIQGATDHLLQLETRLVDSSVLTEQSVVREFVEAIVEIDIHFGRAVDAAIKSTRANLLPELLAASIQEDFENRGIISRWFCRRFFKSVLRVVASNLQANVDHSTNEGLTMVVSRIRRIMSDRDIERAETVGQPFDAETMHAIASVESDQHKAGHVEEQLSAAYFWRGELFRCAEVRVAR